MRCSRSFHKYHPIECGYVLSYEGCLLKGHPYPGNNLSRRNPSFFRDHSALSLHNNSPVKKKQIMNAQLSWNQTSNLYVTPTMLLILWVVLWVTHHIRLPLPSLNSDFLLVAWHRVRSVDIVEEAEKIWRKREKPFTLLRLWRRLRFDARVLACPVRLTTTRANPGPTLSQ